MSKALYPSLIHYIGNMLSISWNDESESYISAEWLRAHSPSADQAGERDLLGRQIGGSSQKKFPGVEVKRWNMIGGYALQLIFSDGHQTGLYTFEYLKELAQSEEVSSRE
jgi:DUF971 family protein